MRSLRTTMNYIRSIFPEPMFLLVFVLTVSPAVPVSADTTDTKTPSSSSDGSKTRLLNGSLEDQEHMRPSVKLLLDPPERPPAPLTQPTPPTPRQPLSGSAN